MSDNRFPIITGPSLPIGMEVPVEISLKDNKGSAIALKSNPSWSGGANGNIRITSDDGLQAAVSAGDTVAVGDSVIIDIQMQSDTGDTYSQEIGFTVSDASNLATEDQTAASKTPAIAPPAEGNEEFDAVFHPPAEVQTQAGTEAAAAHATAKGSGSGSDAESGTATHAKPASASSSGKATGIFKKK